MNPNAFVASRCRRWPAPRLVALLTCAVLWAAGLEAGSRPPSTPAPWGRVEGRVTTADGQAVPGALARLVGSAAPGDVTGADGRFRLEGVPTGRHRLRVELEGLAPREQPVDVGAGTTTRIDVELAAPAFSESVTLTVTPGDRVATDGPAHVTVLTRDDLRRWPAPALDEALRQVPSFSLFRRTSSVASHPATQGVSLRGVGASGASRTLVLIDGVPHNDAFGNWVRWDDVPQVQIESVEAAPSGLSSLYGSSAMAGVIQIFTRQPEPRTASLRGSAGSRGSVDAQAFASHRTDALAASVGGSVFRTDGYTLVRDAQRGAIDVAAASRHRTGNWRLEWRPSPSLTLSHNGRVSGEDRRNGTPLQVNSTRETYLGGGLQAVTRGGSLWQANVFTHGDALRSTEAAAAPDRTSERLTLEQAIDYGDLGANTLWSRELGRSHRMAAGVDARRVGAHCDEDLFVPSGANARDRTIRGEQLYLGGYVEDVFTPASRISLTLGLRADYWRNYGARQAETDNATGATETTTPPGTSHTQVSPRAGLVVHVDERLSVRGSVYGGFRAPSLNELYRPFRVANIVTQANPELGPERLLGTELGLSHATSARFSWRATAFWDRVSDPIANVTTSVTPSLIERRKENLGSARVRGGSLEADLRLEPLRLRASYLLSDSRIREFAAAPQVEGNQLPQVPRHRASLSVDYARPDVVNVSLRGRYESVRYDDDRNRLPLDRLFVVDLILDRSFGESWGAFVSVENLLDRRYPVRATPVDLLGTPRTVTVGLRLDLGPRPATAGAN